MKKLSICMVGFVFVASLICTGLFANVEQLLGRETLRQVQQSLQQSGFDPGPLDGIVGPLTRQALFGYQKELGLEYTGTVNEETLKSLGVEAPELERSRGLVGRAASGVMTAGKATVQATKTAGKATARGTTVAAKTTARGATAAADATATGGKAVARGTTTGAKATATGGKTVARGTATGAKAVGRATSSAASTTKDVLVGPSADRQLANRVEEALREEASLGKSQVGVEAKDGAVTLTFKGDYVQRDRVVALVEKVAGVKQVHVRNP